jgi:hypothetical protein
MMSVRVWQGGALILLVTTQTWLLLPLPGSEPQRGSEPQLVQAFGTHVPCDDLIGQLDDDSFALRQHAALSLTRMAVPAWFRNESATCDASDGSDASDGGDVLDGLRRALHHPSLEVRLAAAKILQQVAREAQQAQLDRLLNPHCDPAAIQLEHWGEFASLAGDDLPARQAFAALVRRCLGRVRPSMPAREAAQRGRDSDELQLLAARVDPYMLDPQDTPLWMALLMLDLQGHESLAHLTPRLSIALSHCPMGPAPRDRCEAEVLQRLMLRWIGESSSLCGHRERLLIALRYDCRDAANETCRKVLEDAESPAPLAATGLLVASVLQRTDLPAHALARLDDDRVACVWQLIPSRRTKIVTEVRDVALAVLLHHHGIDPRDAGYQDLQADPLLGFQDQSLGFSDPASRTSCRMRSAELLASTIPQELQAWLYRLGERPAAD